ncbi:MAG: NADPH:quinone oxidoreductase family protein [Pseudomonadota bacterium]|nr:NADPH:quinone oxidoreductase family protein [Pseudomonadota bacterium]
MEGLVIHEFGPINSHKVEEFKDPLAGKGEVVVDVHAIGLNFPDTLMVQGKYQMWPDRPFVPGRDAVGVISGVGNDIETLKIGDRVACQVLWGAFGTKVCAPEAKVFKLPDEVDFVSAAGMITTYNTAHVAVYERGNVQSGETVFITGASGGVGLAMVEMAKARGATVLAGATSKEKGNIAIKHGADYWIDLSVDDLHEGVKNQVIAAVGEDLCEVVLDVVGGKVFDAAMRCLAYRGRMVIVGFATMDISMPKGHHILLKNISIIGAPLDINFKKSIDVIHRGVEIIFDLWKSGKIKPEISQIISLNEIIPAIQSIADRTAPGKIVITTKYFDNN